LSPMPETSEPNSTQGIADSTRRLFATAILRARQALLWERLWPIFASLAVAAGFFLALSWGGLWISIPPLARMIGLLLFALLLIACFVPAYGFRTPKDTDALRRLDHVSGREHRPATAMADSMAAGSEDPVADTLWRAHLARSAEAARNLRAGWPKPRLAARDPFALRALVLLACVATFFMAEGERGRRIAAAFDWTGAIAPKLYRVDAWVTPPSYTGRPPVLLPGIRHDTPAPGEMASIPVPAGSVLIVRATGMNSIDLAVTGGLSEEPPGEKSGSSEASVERHFRIGDHGGVTVRGLPAGAATWNFGAIPDKPPVIAHTREPQIIGRSSISFAYRVEDDYGVSSAEARFSRKPETPRAGAPAPRQLVPPPDFPLPLPQSRTRAGTGQASKDLTEHPWAGVAVNVTLAAKDEGGNEGFSETQEVQIPERPFTKPLARALVEQRRNLAFDANAREDVHKALTALMIAPERFTPESSVYLGLRTAATRTQIAKTDDDLRDVVDYLWEIAVLIEDGTLSDVERELRAAQEALRQALEQGASEDEIKRLTDNLRQALDRFMQALAEQLKRDGTTEARPLDRNMRTVRPQDLRGMLDKIERLARQGARDAARKLLDEMQAMLDNLSRNQQARGNQNQGDGGMLDELGRMIQEQQRLRDRTFREGRDGQGNRDRRNREQGQQQQGQQGQQGRRQMGDLQRNQQNLRQQLEQMLEQLRRMQQGQQGQQGEGQEGQQGEGNEAGEALGRAGQAMREAEGSLGEGDADNAVEGQGRALQNLRRGAQSLAQQMQGGQGEGPGEPGGPEAESAERTDPLGRPIRSREYGDDFTVKVPDEIDVQRARRVLEELRRRLGEQARPRLELDYIERLLRDF
jgi:uncharacterized protein (TIGR02302 family)